MKHKCHALDCKKTCSPSLLMCPKHWRMVPGPIKREVLRFYRPGQERDKNPSDDYILAARKAIAAVAILEGKEPPTYRSSVGISVTMPRSWNNASPEVRAAGVSDPLKWIIPDSTDAPGAKAPDGWENTATNRVFGVILDQMGEAFGAKTNPHERFSIIGIPPRSADFIKAIESIDAKETFEYEDKENGVFQARGRRWFLRFAVLIPIQDPK